MIHRDKHVRAVLRRLRSFPVVALSGPRQIGKTTLARQVADAYSGAVHHLDLENPADLNRLLEAPVLVLDELRGLVVLDEVQRRPDLFPVLRVLADRQRPNSPVPSASPTPRCGATWTS